MCKSIGEKVQKGLYLRTMPTVSDQFSYRLQMVLPVGYNEGISREKPSRHDREYRVSKAPIGRHVALTIFLEVRAILKFIPIPEKILSGLRMGIRDILVVAVVLFLLAQSNLPPADEYESVRAFTRNEEFDYLSWTIDALVVKAAYSAVESPRYLSVEDQRKVVEDYFELVSWINRTSSAVNRMYADPTVTDPEKAARELSDRLVILRDMEKSQKPIVESILEYQVSVVVGEMGLGVAGQPIPPVMYHVTSLPNALIVSPRNEIRQQADISLLPDITTEQITQIEQDVEQNLNVSALVVPVGGVGTYPTMVMSTTDLRWLLEVISHEWIHNYLTLHPLGVNYFTTPQLRTMNETTANIAGNEIGWAVLERYYPDIAAQMEPPELIVEKEEEETSQPAGPTPTPTPDDPEEFKFTREMHKTRVHVDELLAQGKIDEAESYMEMRRQLFWEKGYRIRRLNQAYFAFYGAYADSPGGGAAGKDPVGPAVQRLRLQSSSLTGFIKTISWLTSFDQLQELVGK